MLHGLVKTMHVQCLSQHLTNTLLICIILHNVGHHHTFRINYLLESPMVLEIHLVVFVVLASSDMLFICFYFILQRKGVTVFIYRAEHFQLFQMQSFIKSK